MKIISFEELTIWKEGINLIEEIYKLTASKNWIHEFALKEQLRKSAISVPSNISEGFERNSDAEFKRFLLIAKGSCGELRTQLLIAYRVSLIEENEYLLLTDKAKILSAQISKLIVYLKNK